MLLGVTRPTTTSRALAHLRSVPRRAAQKLEHELALHRTELCVTVFLRALANPSYYAITFSRNSFITYYESVRLSTLLQIIELPILLPNSTSHTLMPHSQSKLTMPSQLLAHNRPPATCSVHALLTRFGQRGGADGRVLTQ